MIATKDIGPGTYEDLPNEAYHAGPGVSRSMLHELLKGTPRDFLWTREFPEERTVTDAMEFGTACHTAVFEPELLDDTVVEQPEEVDLGEGELVKLKVRRGKAWEAVKREHEGKLILRPGRMADLYRLRDSVYANGNVKRLIDKGNAEISRYWEDASTGELVRTRPDFLSDVKPIAIDLKTAAKLDDRFIKNRIIEGGADMQAAMFLEGFEHLAASLLLFVQTSGPCDYRIINVDPALMKRGHGRYRRALDLYHECKESGEWPGRSHKLETFEWQEWELRDE